MVAGLRERELLRDLYGRQVGADVAREALERGGARSAATSATVSALFVDVIGSTALAQRESPERVVALLNDFFAIVVDVVARARRAGQQVRGRRRAVRLRRAGRPARPRGPRARRRARPARAARRARRAASTRRSASRAARPSPATSAPSRPLRVHGHRRPGQRGLAPDRARQADLPPPRLDVATRRQRRGRLGSARPTPAAHRQPPPSSPDRTGVDEPARSASRRAAARTHHRARVSPPRRPSRSASPAVAGYGQAPEAIGAPVRSGV